MRCLGSWPWNSHGIDNRTHNGNESGRSRPTRPVHGARAGGSHLYKAFAQLAPHLVAPEGRVVALLPGAWSSDLGTRDLRRLYLDHLRVARWTSFENLRRYFPIDCRYKFGVLTADRDAGGTRSLRVRGFAFSAREMFQRHPHVSACDLEKLGGDAQDRGRRCRYR